MDVRYLRPTGVGALLGRFQMTEGPCRPSQLAVQFTSEGSTLSGCDIQLLGTGYRLSLVKKRFAAGQFLRNVCAHCLVRLNSSNALPFAPQGNIWQIISGPVCEGNQKNQWLFDCEDYGSIPCLVHFKLYLQQLLEIMVGI